jgi:hypothetical protein
MIYFHGNSLSRTAPIRIDFYKVHNWTAVMIMRK